jgi:hypothetical protein
MTLDETMKLKAAYGNILNNVQQVKEDTSSIVYDDYDRQMFDYVRNEDIVKSYNNPNNFIILMDIDDNRRKQKFDDVCKHFGFSYTIGDYDEEEDGFPLMPDEKFRSALAGYFKRVDELDVGEMSMLKNKLDNMFNYMSLLEDKSSDIKLEIDEVLGNNMDYDDKSPIRNLLYTIEAKMAYFYKYLNGFEKDIESLKRYR